MLERNVGVCPAQSFPCARREESCLAKLPTTRPSSVRRRPGAARADRLRSRARADHTLAAPSLQAMFSHVCGRSPHADTLLRRMISKHGGKIRFFDHNDFHAAVLLPSCGDLIAGDGARFTKRFHRDSL